MLLLGVIFALLTIGFVVPCVIDVARTPRYEFDLPTKQTWLIVIVGFWVFGAAAWVLVGRRDLRIRRAWNEMTMLWAFGPEQARRHPTGRGWEQAPRRDVRQLRAPAVTPVRFIAPDDNPAFLLELDRRIRGWREEF
jgi:hypothetical protein